MMTPGQHRTCIFSVLAGQNGKTQSLSVRLRSPGRMITRRTPRTGRSPPEGRLVGVADPCVCLQRSSGVASGGAVDDLTQSCGERLWLTRVAKLATEEAPVMARELGQRLIQRLGRRRRRAPGHRGS
jgi:hypothetical protein